MKAMKMLVVVFALVGCSGSGTVSLSARAGAPKLGTAPASLRSALTLSDGITVDRVRMVLSKIELDRSLEGEEHEGEHDDREEVAVGPLLIDLAAEQLEGGVQKTFDAEVPVGHYESVEFEIDRLDAAEAGNDAALAELAARGASFIVDGTIDGQGFTFSSGLEQSLEREAAVEVGAGTNNVTLNLDPSGWFRGAAGRLDPRNEALRAQIERNIERSIDPYEDDDQDGAED